MNNEKNGMKISLKDDNKDKAVKKPAPKPPRQPVKKAPPKPPVKKPARPRPAQPGRPGGSWLKALIAAAVAAAIVGGAIYSWQKKDREEAVLSARQDAQQEKQSFEERLRNLKNQLIGVESEKEELAKRAAELEKRAELLAKAKIEYADEELGLAFEYPALLGEITLTKTEVASGTKFLGTFSDNDKLVFGGVSADLEASPEMAESGLAATDTMGYSESRGDYAFLGPGDLEYGIEPVENIEARGGEILLLDKSSFAASAEADSLPVDIGENLAALLNLDNGKFPGLAFVNSDFSLMPPESFKAMLRTINIEQVSN